jgi:hypothetical protein
MIYTTEDTSDIIRSFFSVALVCQVVTWAFGGSQFEVGIIFGVPISLTVCTMSNVPGVYHHSSTVTNLLSISSPSAAYRKRCYKDRHIQLTDSRSFSSLCTTVSTLSETSGDNAVCCMKNHGLHPIAVSSLSIWYPIPDVLIVMCIQTLLSY